MAGSGARAIRPPDDSRPLTSCPDQDAITRLFQRPGRGSLGGPQWLVDRRLQALEEFVASTAPVIDEDMWRYSRISELDLGQFAPSGSDAPAGPAPALQADAFPAFAALLEHVGDRSGLALVVDGVLVSFELSAQASASGAVLGSVLDDARRSQALDQVASLNVASGYEEHEPDVFDHLADAFLRDAVVLSVPARARIDHPIVIVHLLGSRRPPRWDRRSSRVRSSMSGRRPRRR